jgi:hypothetical protein
LEAVRNSSSRLIAPVGQRVCMFRGVLGTGLCVIYTSTVFISAVLQVVYTFTDFGNYPSCAGWMGQTVRLGDGQPDWLTTLGLLGWSPILDHPSKWRIVFFGNRRSVWYRQLVEGASGWIGRLPLAFRGSPILEHPSRQLKVADCLLWQQTACLVQAARVIFPLKTYNHVTRKNITWLDCTLGNGKHLVEIF